MPFLQSSGQISIANLNGFFPGSGTSMSNFYRGGGRVPATKTVQTRDPSSGAEYNNSSFWQFSGGLTVLRWRWTYILYNANIGNPASYTSGGVTYYKAGAVLADSKNNFYQWEVYTIVTSTPAINTGIPSSGQISLSQFYGAEVP